MSNLGKEGTDKITGFSGVITSEHAYITGCDQYGLTPQCNKDSQVLKKTEWFDSSRVTVGEQVVNPEAVQVEKPGCDYRANPENH